MAGSNSNSNSSQSSTDSAKKSRKRQHPIVLNGVGNTCEDRNSDFLCPICLEVISEAHMTKCGHTFCYSCITKTLEQSNRCPKCNYVIEKKDQVFPNFVLNELITKQQQKLNEKKAKPDLKLQGMTELKELLTKDSESLCISDVNYMLEVLSQKKRQMESDGRETQMRLLKEFLVQVRSQKHQELKKVNEELSLIEHDSKVVEEMLQQHLLAHSSKTTVERTAAFAEKSKTEPSTSKSCKYNNYNHVQESFNGIRHSKKHLHGPTLASRQKRIHAHFDDLQQTYFSTRMRNGPFCTSDDAKHCLNEFTESLAKFTKFTSVRPLATLNYAHDHFNSSNIVSSIEFDKDHEYFAIAGVTKKIKMFEYSAVICDTVDMHYPVNEMICNSKISCVSWSSYHKAMLASSDYEGTVVIWDAFTGQKVKVYQEHEKRCWSVDFNKVDTKLIASGSDDSKVKLWSTSMENSITCLEAKANVCCVKFNPESRYHLTFGSADHCVHYYDLRNIKQPLEVFKGHKKAVSYVKFLNSNVVVSASTDSQLKLWNVNQSSCLRSFKGHQNEKNFVGLANNSDFIACGSENNSLYVYYKGLSSHVLSFRFDTIRGILEGNKRDEDINEFVSAVCWKQGSDIVVAANSQGTIKVLELH